MSSIAGVFDPAGRLPSDGELREALSVMERRGADSVSIFRDDCCAMAVAVFDPTEDKRNPGFAIDPETGTTIVIDGMLDSVELGSDEGRAFARSLRENPDDTLKTLRGDFALAASDSKRRQLTLVRDHLGTRPLCFAQAEGGRVLFASTPSAVVALGHKSAPDMNAIFMLLQLGIMPGPWSGWSGVERLGPSERIVADADGLQKSEYWRFHLADKTAISEQDHITEVRQRLEQAISEQLAGCDDPLFCMSGGIDSTAIAGLARKVLGKRIRTICLGFSGDIPDDRPFARRASEELDTDHCEIEISPQKVADQLDGISAVLEVPSLLSFTEFLLTQHVAGQTRVLVTGETADSQFGGTSVFILLRRLAQYRKIPRILRRSMAWCIRKTIPPSLKIAGKHPGQVIRFLDDSDRASSSGRYLAMRSVFTPDESANLLNGASFESNSVMDYIDALFADYENSPANAFLAALTRHESPNEYLRDDFKSARPVVYRSPFTSLGVVEAAMRIPPGLKVKNGVQKHILIEAVRDVLPEEVITRPKMGFSLPMNDWLSGPLRSAVQQALSEEYLPTFLNAESITAMRDRFFAGDVSVNWKQIMLLVMLSRWGHLYMR